MRPVTQPDREAIYVHNSVRRDNMFIVYPLDVFLQSEAAEAATMIRAPGAQEFLLTWSTAPIHTRRAHARARTHEVSPLPPAPWCRSSAQRSSVDSWSYRTANSSSRSQDAALMARDT
jgi:hypothetical protein